ncbi:hypothetical protein C2845_PM03G19330 [Panicum miliaceum]|uniref:Uncharacterized protein n=1 Tax=Panicum miliaceum TaxID=4540 RepID=A0A3L6TCS8_PANMI|nr:hypothetical protein C2845_PM03G19330 [Panicum miliaceum]
MVIVHPYFWGAERLPSEEVWDGAAVFPAYGVDWLWPFVTVTADWSLSVDSLERNYLRSIWHELHELCCDPGRNFTGSFRQRHWSEPLVLAAFVVTFCFFIFQLLLVILTLIPLYRSTKAAVESNK